MEKPSTPGVEKAIQKLEENMDSKWKNRKKIGELAEQKGFTTCKNMMAILSTYREYIETNTDLETEERPEGQGSATVYWRLAK